MSSITTATVFCGFNPSLSYVRKLNIVTYPRLVPGACCHQIMNLLPHYGRMFWCCIGSSHSLTLIL